MIMTFCQLYNFSFYLNQCFPSCYLVFNTITDWNILYLFCLFSCCYRVHFTDFRPCFLCFIHFIVSFQYHETKAPESTAIGFSGAFYCLLQYRTAHIILYLLRCRNELWSSKTQPLTVPEPPAPLSLSRCEQNVPHRRRSERCYRSRSPLEGTHAAACRSHRSLNSTMPYHAAALPQATVRLQEAPHSHSVSFPWYLLRITSAWISGRLSTQPHGVQQRLSFSIRSRISSSQLPATATNSPTVVSSVPSIPVTGASRLLRITIQAFSCIALTIP